MIRGIQNVVKNSARGVERTISNISDTIDSSRGTSKKKVKKPNFPNFKKAWDNYNKYLNEFLTDCAAERMDSVEAEMEEFFEVDQEGDLM